MSADLRPADPIAAVTHPDPYPYYADLTATRPIHRDEALGLWVACSAATVTAVLESPACLVRPPSEPVPRALVGSPAGSIFGRLVRMNDGAKHSALKPAVSAATVDLEKHVGEPARRWAEHLFKALKPADDPARVNEFAFTLSGYVLASMLGVAPDMLARIAAMVGDFARSIAPGATSEQLAPGSAAASELLAVFRGLLNARDTASPATLLGDLDREVARAGHDDREDVVANGIGFLSQAYEATTGLIGNTLVTLGGRGQARPASLANGDQLEAFVREVVRYDPPVHNTRRFLARDAVVAGQAMKAGDVVLVVLAAVGLTSCGSVKSLDPYGARMRGLTDVPYPAYQGADCTTIAAPRNGRAAAKTSCGQSIRAAPGSASSATLRTSATGSCSMVRTRTLPPVSNPCGR